VAILPVLNLIQQSFKQKQQPPPPAELQALKPLLDLGKIQVKGRALRLAQGMMLTFDGVAKGDAVDRVVERLEAAGLQNYLVNFSGNMRWRGEKSAGKPWKLQSWNPIQKTGVDLPSLKAGRVASSGPEHAAYSKDRAWHHLIDPQSLRPARNWSQTTVWGPSAAICDLLSTATFAMSEAEIRETLQKHFPDYQARIVTLDGRQSRL
jgi:thiamine biosynthesis lipoprotein